MAGKIQRGAEQAAGREVRCPPQPRFGGPCSGASLRKGAWAVIWKESPPVKAANLPVASSAHTSLFPPSSGLSSCSGSSSARAPTRRRRRALCELLPHRPPCLCPRRRVPSLHRCVPVPPCPVCALSLRPAASPHQLAADKASEYIQERGTGAAGIPPALSHTERVRSLSPSILSRCAPEGRWRAACLQSWRLRPAALAPRPLRQPSRAARGGAAALASPAVREPLCRHLTMAFLCVCCVRSVRSLRAWTASCATPRSTPCSRRSREPPS